MTRNEHGGAGETMLVVQAAGGDAEAFDALHRRHAERAWRLAVAVTGDAAAAATVVPEAVAATFTGIRAGVDSPEADYGTLLLRAVRNAALDLERARRARGEADGPASTHGLPLGRAFGALPERWRSALWLTIVEDVAPGSVAPIVDLSAADTAKLAGRARRGLQERFLRAHLAESGNRHCARAVARLARHADGSLDDGDREKLDRHLRLCGSCAERREHLDDLPSRLSSLAPAPPAALREDSRAAWTAAVTPTKARTATGLSPMTEKLLAGVGAVAAAAGVVGAALLGSTNGRGDREQAGPVSPAASTETGSPQPLDLDPGIDVPSIGANSGAPTPRGRSSSGGSDTPVVGTSNPTEPSTSAGDLSPSPSPAPSPAVPPSPPTTSPVEPRTSPPDDGGTSEPAGTDEPLVEVGTIIADQPVAVEVGPTPGVTVGPVSVGSEPQPTKNEEPIDVGGPLAPAGDAVSEVLDPLG